MLLIHVSRRIPLFKVIRATGVISSSQSSPETGQIHVKPGWSFLTSLPVLNVPSDDEYSA